MMLASDHSFIIISNDFTNQNIILEELGDVFFESDKYTILETQNASVDKLLKETGCKFEKYLDRFYLVFSLSDQHQNLVDYFFKFISLEYNSLINIERNVKNISKMLDWLLEQNSKESKINLIDYGSGTGLSLNVIDKNRVTLIGIDLCSEMRLIAKANGMLSYGIEEAFTEIKNESIDGFFFSYVFHYMPTKRDFELVKGKLKTGGFVIGNTFHNLHVEYVENTLNSIGLVAIEHNLSSPIEGERYLIYKKEQ